MNSNASGYMMLTAGFVGFFGLAALPATADVCSGCTMPSPSRAETWINHTESTVLLGADFESQHFARAQVDPQQFGQFKLTVRCENGSPGTWIRANFAVQFLADDRIVTLRSEDCNYFRPFNTVGNIIVIHTQTFSLSQQELQQIKFVRLFASPL
jgi:hypothetical protein